MVMENPTLPRVTEPVMSTASEKYEMQEMDEAAKKYPKQEKAFFDQLREMRMNSLLDAKDWEEMNAAFRMKSE